MHNKVMNKKRTTMSRLEQLYYMKRKSVSMLSM